jgi:hypothetical protein
MVPRIEFFAYGLISFPALAAASPGRVVSNMSKTVFRASMRVVINTEAGRGMNHGGREGRSRRLSGAVWNKLVSITSA